MDEIRQEALSNVLRLLNNAQTKHIVIIMRLLQAWERKGGRKEWKS